MDEAHGMSWTTHPFRRHKLRGAAALLVAAGTVAAVQAWARTPLLTAAAALVLLLSLWTFYFPTRWRLGEDGVEADYGLWRRRWAWDRFQAFWPLPDGAVVSPFRWPHRLERWRAVALPCPEQAARLQELLAVRLRRREADGGPA